MAYGKRFTKKTVEKLSLFDQLAQREQELTKPQKQLKEARDEGRLVYKGLKFDSFLEVERYIHLEFLKDQGKIQSFIYHPTAFTDLVWNGVRIFERYTADFCVIMPDGSRVWEDTKPGYIDPEWRGEKLHKARAFRASTERDTRPRIQCVEARYGIRVKFVYHPTEMPDISYAHRPTEKDLYS